MPNNVTNAINFFGKAENIKVVMRIIRGDDEDSVIDFNRLIPMPDELDIDHGSDLYNAMNVYLTLINPNSAVEAEGLEKLDAHAFEEIMNRSRGWSFVSKNAMLKMSEIKEIAESITENGKIGEVISRGKTGIDNLMKYGAVSWYDWRCDHWGTKWNAYNQSADSDTSITFDTAWSIPEPILQELASICYYQDVWFEGQFVSKDWMSYSGWFESDGDILNVCYDDTKDEAAERANAIWGYDPREDCDNEE